MNTTACRGRSCRAQIVWAWTGAKSLPVDPEPSDDGNVRLTETTRADGSTGWLAEVLGPLEVELEQGELHMPHWATCPNAEDFR